MVTDPQTNKQAVQQKAAAAADYALPTTMPSQASNPPPQWVQLVN